MKAACHHRDTKECQECIKAAVNSTNSSTKWYHSQSN